MKQPSFLNAVSQPHPHRTSLHSHMQSTAYHYNSLLNAKPKIDNNAPNSKISLDALNNKRAKNLKKQRNSQNQKLLKSLIDIQRNYSLYGTKNHSELSNQNKSTFYKTKRKSFDPFDNKKTLKNPFVQKMERLKISQENLKLFQKISTAQSSFANKKQMKRWNNKLNYVGSFLQSSRSKDLSQQLKNQFFSTFVKMRETNNIAQCSSRFIRLQPKSLMMNPEMRTLSHSKRMIDEQKEISMKQSFRIKKDKRRSRKLRRIETQEGGEFKEIRLYTENSNKRND